MKEPQEVRGYRALCKEAERILAVVEEYLLACNYAASIGDITDLQHAKLCRAISGDVTAEEAYQ